MESLAEILGGASAPAVSETPANAPAKTEKSEPAKDVKPTESAKADPTASATSAEQAKPEAKASEVKPDVKSGEAAKTEAKEGEQPRDDKGRFKSLEELQTELAGQKAATKAERTKRQEAERRLQEREAAKPKDEKPKTDFWTDPDAALDERLTPELQALRHEMDVRWHNRCEKEARKAHADYEEVLAELIEETDADRSLAQQVFSTARALTQAGDDPAEYLYKTAVNRREMKAVGGDLGKYKESVAEPFKAQVAERDQTITGLQKEVKSLKDQLEKIGKVPASLNAEPSASRGAVASEAAENESLGEIFKPSKRRA